MMEGNNNYEVNLVPSRENFEFIGFRRLFVSSVIL